MNVLRTIETFLPYICGPANQAFQISNRLEERGIHSPVLTTYCDVSASLPPRDKIDRVRVIRTTSQFQVMRYCVSLGMVKLLTAGDLKDFDIVHSHNYRNFQTDCGFFFPN
ncbi:MAG: hypothetical protein HY579_14270 [Nitrospinae bacterium]|nr:hypothetical protein [Nitrospinota bacterium]